MTAVATTVALLACGNRRSPSLYEGYVAQVEHAPTFGAPIPRASEIRIGQVGMLGDLPLYFADGGRMDDTPPFRIVGCTDQYASRHHALHRRWSGPQTASSCGPSS